MKTQREHGEETGNEDEIATIRDKDSGIGWEEIEREGKKGQSDKEKEKTEGVLYD